MAGAVFPRARERFVGAAPNVGMAIAVAAILAAAASLAGGQTLAPSGAPRAAVEASAASFAERFNPGPPAPDCGGRNWPYIAAECLRGPDGSPVRPVRIIAIDRQIPVR